MRIRPVPALISSLVFLLAGCFPVELAVTRGGEVVIPRSEGVVFFNPSTGAARVAVPAGAREAALFAVPSPSGDRVLWALSPRDNDGDPSSEMTLRISPLAGGNAADIATVSNCGYLQWDPQERYVSYAFVGGETSEGLSEAMPELHLIDLASGTDATVARNTAFIHRWLPGGDGIVFLKTESKDTDGTVGSLRIQRPGGSEAKRVVRVLDAEWFDLAPDGREVVLAARAVAAPSGKLIAADDEKALFLVSLPDGAIRRVGGSAEFCRYSPDGKRIAALADNALVIYDRTFNEPLCRAERVLKEVDGTTKYFPAWLNGDEVLVLRKRAIYGAAGKTLELVAIDAGTGAERPLQDAIEAGLRANR